MDNQETPKQTNYYDNYLMTAKGNDFLDKRTGTLIGERTFNSRHINDVEETTKLGVRIKPCKHVEGKIEDFEACTYNPLKKERSLYTSEDGEKLFNTYKKLARKEVTKEEEAEGRAFLDGHFDWLFEDEKTKKLFFDWMAHQIQNPGKLLRWMPLIIGTKGDGKSTIADILKKIIGSKNIKPLSAKIMLSQFSGWAAGSSISFIHEFKLPHNDKTGTTESFKDFISNETIFIEPKGDKPRDVTNVTNYCGTSNYPEHIPIESDDRRFWAIRTKHLGITMTKEWKAKKKEHHKKLRKYLKKENSANAFNQALMNHQISEEFRELDEAPESAFKNKLEADSRDENELAIIERFELAGREVLAKYFVPPNHFKINLFQNTGFSKLNNSNECLYDLKKGKALTQSLSSLKFIKSGVSKDRKQLYKIPKEYLHYFSQGAGEDHTPHATEPKPSEDITIKKQEPEAKPDNTKQKDAATNAKDQTWAKTQENGKKQQAVFDSKPKGVKTNLTKDNPFKTPSDDYLGLNKENSNNTELQGVN